jgi:hypothetical protein
MASVLRASTTLQFPAFRAFALRYFESRWSTRLEDLTAEPLPRAQETLVLGHKYDMPGVTKRALYDVVRMPNFGLSAGREREAGAADEGDDRRKDDILTLTDLRLLVKARTILTEMWHYAIQHHHSSAKASCPHVGRSALPTAVFQSGLFQEYQYDPICGLEKLAQARWDVLPDECMEAQREFWETTREVLWKDLETWFEL